MSVMNPELFMAQHWDWACINDIFPGKIEVSDVDGAVERKGHFLFIETKQPFARLRMGQEIFYRNLALKPDMTVLVVWGDPGKPERVRILHGDFDKTYRTDLDGLRYVVGRWWDHAEHIPATWRASFT